MPAFLSLDPVAKRRIHKDEDNLQSYHYQK